MDRKTQEVLRRIGESIPDHLKKNITKIDQRDELDVKMREGAEDMLRRLNRTDNGMRLNTEATEKMRKMAKDFIHKYDNAKLKERNNPEVAGEINKYYDQKIKQAIARGEIKPADKNDPFLKRIKMR